MALNNHNSSSGIVDAFNVLNHFGKLKEDDIVYCKSEQKEREERFMKEKLKTEEERKKQAKEKRDKEIEDEEFLNAEDRRLKGMKKHGIAYYRSPRAKTCGRGSLLEGAVRSEGLARGRGSSSLALPLFDRQEKVQRKIDQFGTNLHNNNVQKSYWTAHGPDDNQEEEEYSTHFSRYTPDSLTHSEKYEDAFDSPQSDSPQSFLSVSNSPVPLSCEPASVSTDSQQHQTCLEVTPSPPRPRKPRGSRIAARFSYLEDEANGTEGKQTPEVNKKSEDLDGNCTTLESSWAPPLSIFKKSCRSAGMSFKNLNPSQRVLSNGILTPEELYQGFAHSGARSDFAYDVKDFPTL